MAKAQKNRASKIPYVSPNQLEFVGFESPFTKHLDANNRWVRLAKQIPWDKIANVYRKQLNHSITGAEGINPRVAIGAKHDKKPRTYRENARKVYLKTAEKKKKTKKEIRVAIRKQLGFLKRDIKGIYKLLDSFEKMPFNPGQYKYFLVIQTLYDQQEKLYREKTHSIEHLYYLEISISKKIDFFIQAD